MVLAAHKKIFSDARANRDVARTDQPTSRSAGRKRLAHRTDMGELRTMLKIQNHLEKFRILVNLGNPAVRVTYRLTMT